MRVQELADACVRYVRAAVGVELDYQPETLPALDHYVSSRRQEVAERPEAAATAGEAKRRQARSRRLQAMGGTNPGS